jgi:hypothetical protein
MSDNKLKDLQAGNSINDPEALGSKFIEMIDNLPDKVKKSKKIKSKLDSCESKLSNAARDDGKAAKEVLEEITDVQLEVNQKEKSQAQYYSRYFEDFTNSLVSNFSRELENYQQKDLVQLDGSKLSDKVAGGKKSAFEQIMHSDKNKNSNIEKVFALSSEIDTYMQKLHSDDVNKKLAGSLGELAEFLPKNSTDNTQTTKKELKQVSENLKNNVYLTPAEYNKNITPAENLWVEPARDELVEENKHKKLDEITFPEKDSLAQHFGELKMMADAKTADKLDNKELKQIRGEKPFSLSSDDKTPGANAMIDAISEAKLSYFSHNKENRADQEIFNNKANKITSTINSNLGLEQNKSQIKHIEQSDGKSLQEKYHQEIKPKITAEELDNPHISQENKGKINKKFRDIEACMEKSIKDQNIQQIGERFKTLSSKLSKDNSIKTRLADFGEKLGAKTERQVSTTMGAAESQVAGVDNSAGRNLENTRVADVGPNSGAGISEAAPASSSEPSSVSEEQSERSREQEAVPTADSDGVSANSNAEESREATSHEEGAAAHVGADSSSASAQSQRSGSEQEVSSSAGSEEYREATSPREVELEDHNINTEQNVAGNANQQVEATTNNAYTPETQEFAAERATTTSHERVSNPQGLDQSLMGAIKKQGGKVPANKSSQENKPQQAQGAPEEKPKPSFLESIKKQGGKPVKGGASAAAASGSGAASSAEAGNSSQKQEIKNNKKPQSFLDQIQSGANSLNPVSKSNSTNQEIDNTSEQENYKTSEQENDKSSKQGNPLQKALKRRYNQLHRDSSSSSLDSEKSHEAEEEQRNAEQGVTHKDIEEQKRRERGGSSPGLGGDR